MCRKRGRIVLVGVTGLELARSDFYEKELTFQVSCSYGPGRYDPAYEEEGHDYPVGYVRWTEQRNFEAVLDTLAARKLDVAPLITHRFDIDDAARAYDVIGGSEPSLGVILNYAQGPARPNESPLDSTVRTAKGTSATHGQVAVGLVGAGNYATGVLMPALQSSGARLRTIASVGGVNAMHGARKFGFEQATTDADAVLNDPAIGAVMIATRHDSHAAYVLQARKAGKHVFVEKPLCLTLAELAQIEAAWTSDAPLLMVGFNRRFAPHVRRVKELLLATPGPRVLVATINAGAIPASHWTQDGSRGGGRILGEGCHFVDLLRYLAGSSIVAHTVTPMASQTSDSVTITLRFADGSIGTIHYLANGNKSFPKERVEVFAGGRVLQLDNFRRLKGFGWPQFRKMNLWRQDKGQQACVQAFLAAVRSGAPAPIPLAEILEVSRVSIELQQALG
jgi:predicted dehydrogenase